MFTVYLTELVPDELIKLINALQQHSVIYSDFSCSSVDSILMFHINITIPAKGLEYSLPKICHILGMEDVEMKWIN